MNNFCRLELRTSDVPSARTFYQELLGDETLETTELPAPAVARGAPAHWLGYIGVEDVQQRAEAFADRGATLLGQMQHTGDGGKAVVLRDTAGVVVGLSTPPAREARTRPVWQELYTLDADKASSNYCEMFGWELQERLNLASAGHHQCFAWKRGAANSGSIIDIAGLEGVHAHWLFYFEVQDIAVSTQMVRNFGGTVMGPRVLPDGTRIAICEDRQRAAFGLREAVASKVATLLDNVRRFQSDHIFDHRCSAESSEAVKELK